MANRARGRPLYLARVAVYTAIRVEPWGIYTPHPVWDGGAFLFYSTKIPKSVNKSNLKKQKGKNYD